MPSHKNLGSIFLSKGLFDRAEKEFLEVARLDPVDSDHHTNLGQVYVDTGRWKDTIRELRLALEAAKSADRYSPLYTGHLNFNH
jgi:tetratricopeptide (TPR) repeat protein